MNRTFPAGSQIQSDGVRKASSMKSGDEWKLAVVMETKQGVSTGKVRGV